MSRNIQRLGTAVVLLLCVTFTSGQDVQEKPKELNRIIASVDGDPITWVDLYKRGGTLDSLIQRKLILKSFKKLPQKIEETDIERAVERFVQVKYKGNREQFLIDLKEKGISYDRFKEIQEEQIALRLMEPAYFTAKDKEITNDDKLAIYNQKVAELAKGETVEIQIINLRKDTKYANGISAEQVVKKMAESLKKTKPEDRSKKFDANAKEKKNDKGEIFAENGGRLESLDGNAVKILDLTDKVREAIKNLDTNEFTVFDDGLMWKLVLLNKRTVPAPPKMEIMDKELHAAALELKRKERQNIFLRMVQNNSEVKIYE